MTNPNWGMLPNNSFANALNTGLAFGKEVADARKQSEYKNALMAYSSDPSQANLAPVIAANPEVGMQLMGDHRKQQQQSDKALQGAIGQATLDVMSRPPEQRAAAWDAYVDHFSQSHPNAAQYKGRFSDQLGMSILAETGLMENYQASQQPKYMAIPEGGDLVNARDPNAVRQFQERQSVSPSSPQPQQPKAPAILKSATQRGFITPEEVAAVEADLGPNGKDAFRGWLTNTRVPIGKQMNGQTFYQINGKWYDNPEGR